MSGPSSTPSDTAAHATEPPTQAAHCHAGGGEAAHYLAGGGEMGARIRAFDWSQTSLGPAPDWPQSLRSALGIMLSSKGAPS